MTPEEIIAELRLRPHPEGGHYAETWRGQPDRDGRSRVTAIYYMLRAGERSDWHRVDADEVWTFHAGSTLVLRVGSVTHRLGVDLAAGEHPQVIVPSGEWQSAVSAGDFSLVSCVVAPGFEFAGFELAEPGWDPGSGAASA